MTKIIKYKKGTLMHDFMLIVAGLIIVVIILSTVFGKGVVGNVMGMFGEANPEYLAEEFALLTSTIGYAPGEMEATLKMNVKREIELSYNSDEDDYEVIIQGVSRPFAYDTNTFFTTMKEDVQGIVLIKKEKTSSGIYTISYEVADLE